MSIINSDGLNANWQLNILKGLASINDNAKNVINIGTQLNSILVAIQAGTDYEAAIVLDAAGVTWLEIRIYDSSTSTFNPPVYYLAGTNTPGTPLAPLTYVNPNTYLAQIVTNTTAVNRTPVYFRTTTSGTIAAVTYSFSIANVGSADGTFLGDPIKPGESVNFGADGINNSYAASTFTFDGTGTELLITYNT